MPGTKNSGRKKKVVAISSGTSSLDDAGKSSSSKARGRPKRMQIADSDEKEQDDAAAEIPEQTVKPKPPTHPSTLTKRTSQLSAFYDQYLGPPLSHFPASKLPLKRIVLQRYRGIKSEGHTIQLSSAVGIITKELTERWECSAIPFKDYRGCTKIVRNLIDMWVDAKQEERKSVFFQDDLDTLLDLRPEDCKNIEVLTAKLKKSSGSDWERDLAFIQGQMNKPQSSFMSPTRDTVLDKKVKLKSSKAAKALLYKEKHQSDLPGSSSTPACQPKPSLRGLSESNILPKSSRRSAKSATQNISSIEKDTDKTLGDEDAEWDPPLRFKRELNKKPDFVVLTLPSRQIPQLLAGVSTVTRTSARNELKLVSTLLKVGGVDINDTNLSISTIWRQRKSKVEADAASIRRKIKDLCKSDGYGAGDYDFLVLHCDGKIIQYITGNTEDRLAIAISIPHAIPGQFLASPAIQNGKGDTMANCLAETLNEYGLLEKAEAVVFDTTASNTGVRQGCVFLFEKIIQRAVLWLACRHHTSELFIKHANIEVRGPTTGPDDVLFKLFKKKFNLIDITQLERWIWPANTDWRHQRAEDVLEWADLHMSQGTWPREDYREMVELTVS